MIKLGIISELHLDEWWNYAEPHEEWASSRLADIVQAAEYAFSKFKEKKTRKILHAGDLIHAKNAITIPVLKAARYITQLFSDDQWFIDLESNHGSYDKSGTHHVSQIFNCADYDRDCGYIVLGQDECVTGYNDGIYIYGIPYLLQDNLFEDWTQKLNKLYDESPNKKSQKTVIV